MSWGGGLPSEVAGDDDIMARRVRGVAGETPPRPGMEIEVCLEEESSPLER